MNPLFYQDIANQTVLILGLPRSGTTILGKWIGSLKNCEYAFEPLLFNVFENALQSGRLPEAGVAEMLEAYLAEDLMLPFLHGRNLNFREQDWSCVFNTKSRDEIEMRLNKKINAQTALQEFYRTEARLVVKTLNNWKLGDLLLARYPQSRVIVIERDLFEVAESMYVREWFHAKTLMPSAEQLLWTERDRGHRLHLPLPLKEEQRRAWESGTDADRTLIYVAEIARCQNQAIQSFQKHGSRVMQIRYADLILSPEKTLTDLRHRLRLETGACTDQILREIQKHPSKADRNHPLAGAQKELIQSLEELNRAYAVKSI